MNGAGPSSRVIAQDALPEWTHAPERTESLKQMVAEPPGVCREVDGEDTNLLLRILL